MSLKRNEFDVILPPQPPQPGGGGGTPQQMPPMNGVQSLGSESGEGEGSGGGKTYSPPLQPSSGEKEKKSGGSGSGEGEEKEGKEGEGENEGGKGAGKGTGSKRGAGTGEIKAQVTKVEPIKGRGVGGILTPQESQKLQEELGVPFEGTPDAHDIKQKVAKLQPLLDKNPGSRTQGRGSGGQRLLPDAIAKIVNPIVDWKNLLKKYIGNILGRRSEAVMPNRRFVSSGDYVYGSRKSKDTLNTCVIAIDTSGSIGDKEMALMINEVKGIAQAKKIKKFELVYFDDGISKVDKLTDTQVASYYPKDLSSGGTSFKEPLDYMAEADKSGRLSLAIFMTDGYADLNLPIPKFKNKFIWMIMDHPSFKAPFGDKVVHVEVQGGKS